VTVRWPRASATPLRRVLWSVPCRGLARRPDVHGVAAAAQISPTALLSAAYSSPCAVGTTLFCSSSCSYACQYVLLTPLWYLCSWRRRRCVCACVRAFRPRDSFASGFWPVVALSRPASTVWSALLRHSTWWLTHYCRLFDLGDAWLCFAHLVVFSFFLGTLTCFRLVKVALAPHANRQGSVLPLLDGRSTHRRR